MENLSNETTATSHCQLQKALDEGISYWDTLTILLLASPIGDLKHEVNIFRYQIFPQLCSHAFKYGIKLQFIDPFYAIHELPSMRCEELQQCIVHNLVVPIFQHQRPVFILTLLGDKFGMCPLPSEIPAEEFATFTNIANELEDGSDPLELFYAPPSENDAVPMYRLKTPQEIHPQYPKVMSWWRSLYRGPGGDTPGPVLDTGVVNEVLQFIQKWTSRLSTQLFRQAPQMRARKVEFGEPPSVLQKFTLSQSSQQLCGAAFFPDLLKILFQKEQAQEIMRQRLSGVSADSWVKTFCVFREFENPNFSHKAVGDYFDVVKKKEADKQGSMLLAELKAWLQSDSLLAQTTSSSAANERDNFRTFKVKWFPNGLEPDSIRHQNYLNLFSRDVTARLTRFIDDYANSAQFRDGTSLALDKCRAFNSARDHEEYARLRLRLHSPVSQWLQGEEQFYRTVDQIWQRCFPPQPVEEAASQARVSMNVPAEDTPSLSSLTLVRKLLEKEITALTFSQRQSSCMTQQNTILEGPPLTFLGSNDPQAYGEVFHLTEAKELALEARSSSPVSRRLSTRKGSFHRPHRVTHSPPPRYPMLVCANWGSGKSQLLAELIKRCCDATEPSCRVVSRFICSELAASHHPSIDSASRGYIHFMRRLLADVASAYQLLVHPLLLAEDCEDPGYISQLFLAVLRRISALCSGSEGPVSAAPPPLLLVLGEMDHWAHWRELLRWFHLPFPPHITVLIAISNEQLQVLTCDNTSSLQFDLFHVPPFISPSTGDAALTSLEEVPQQLDRTPLDHLILKGISRVADKELNLIPEIEQCSTKLLLEKYLQLLSQRHGFHEGGLRRMLGYFSAAPIGLTDLEAQDVFSLDDALLQSVFGWDALVTLSNKAGQRENHCQFPPLLWHAVLEHWLRDGILVAVPPLTVHRSLAAGIVYQVSHPLLAHLIRTGVALKKPPEPPLEDGEELPVDHFSYWLPQSFSVYHSTLADYFLGTFVDAAKLVMRVRLGGAAATTTRSTSVAGLSRPVSTTRPVTTRSSPERTGSSRRSTKRATTTSSSQRSRSTSASPQRESSASPTRQSRRTSRERGSPQLAAPVGVNLYRDVTRLPALNYNYGQFYERRLLQVPLAHLFSAQMWQRWTSEHVANLAWWMHYMNRNSPSDDRQQCTFVPPMRSLLALFRRLKDALLYVLEMWKVARESGDASKQAAVLGAGMTDTQLEDMNERLDCVCRLLENAMAELSSEPKGFLQLPHWIASHADSLRLQDPKGHLQKILVDSERSLRVTHESQFIASTSVQNLWKGDTCLMASEKVSLKLDEFDFIQRKPAHFLPTGELLLLSYKLLSGVPCTGIRKRAAFANKTASPLYVQRFVPFVVKEIIGSMAQGRFLLLSGFSFNGSIARKVLYDWNTDTVLHEFTDTDCVLAVHSEEGRVAVYSAYENHVALFVLGEFQQPVLTLRITPSNVPEENGADTDGAGNDPVIRKLSFTHSGSRVVALREDGVVYCWNLFFQQTTANSGEILPESVLFAKSTRVEGDESPSARTDGDPTSARTSQVKSGASSRRTVSISPGNSRCVSALNSIQREVLFSEGCMVPLSSERFIFTEFHRFRQKHFLVMVDLKIGGKVVKRFGNPQYNHYVQDVIVCSPSEKVILSTTSTRKHARESTNKPILVWDVGHEKLASVIDNLKQLPVLAMTLLNESTGLVAVSWGAPHQEESRPTKSCVLPPHVSVWQFCSAPGQYLKEAKCLKYLVPPGLTVTRFSSPTHQCLLSLEDRSVVVTCDSRNSMVHFWWLNEVEKLSLARQSLISSGLQTTAYVKEEDVEQARVAGSTGLAYISDLKVLGHLRASGWWSIYRVQPEPADLMSILTRNYPDAPLHQLQVSQNRFFCFASQSTVYVWDADKVVEVHKLVVCEPATPNGILTTHITQLVAGDDKLVVSVSPTISIPLSCSPNSSALIHSKSARSTLPPASPETAPKPTGNEVADTGCTSPSVRDSLGGNVALVFSVKTGQQLCQVDLADVMGMIDMATSGTLLLSSEASIPLVYHLPTGIPLLPGWTATDRKEDCHTVCLAQSGDPLDGRVWMAVACPSVIRIVLFQHGSSVDATSNAESPLKPLCRLRVPRRFREDFTHSQRGLLHFLPTVVAPPSQDTTKKPPPQPQPRARNLGKRGSRVSISNTTPVETSHTEFRSLLAAVGSRLLIWSLQSGDLERCLDRHRGTIVCLQFSQDRYFLFSGGEDCQVVVWESQEWTCLCTVPLWDTVPHFIAPSNTLNCVFVASAQPGLHPQAALYRLESNEAFGHLRLQLRKQIQDRDSALLRSGPGHAAPEGDKGTRRVSRTTQPPQPTNVLVGKNGELVTHAEKFNLSAGALVRTHTCSELTTAHSTVCCLM